MESGEKSKALKVGKNAVSLRKRTAFFTLIESLTGVEASTLLGTVAAPA